MMFVILAPCEDITVIVFESGPHTGARACESTAWLCLHNNELFHWTHCGPQPAHLQHMCLVEAETMRSIYIMQIHMVWEWDCIALLGDFDPACAHMFAQLPYNTCTGLT